MGQRLGRREGRDHCRILLEPRPTWVRCNESTVPVSQILKSLQEEGAGAECMEGFDSMIALWGYDYLEGLTAFLEGWDPGSGYQLQPGRTAGCSKKG